MLKGKCRHCGARISLWYPAVELATGILFAGLVLRFGVSATTLIYAALGASLILISVVDARIMEIPDQVTIPGLQLGVILSFFFPALHNASSRWVGLRESVLGVLAGAGGIALMGWVGKILFRKKLKAIGEEEAVGGGDLKLMAFVGSVLGAPKVLLASFILAPLFGSLVGLVLKFRYGKDLIPYGPFLALGTVAAIFLENAS